MGTVNPLVTFYDIHGKNGDVLFFSFVFEENAKTNNYFLVIKICHKLQTGEKIAAESLHKIHVKFYLVLTVKPVLTSLHMIPLYDHYFLRIVTMDAF
jgi:hypothetical protein